MEIKFDTSNANDVAEVSELLEGIKNIQKNDCSLIRINPLQFKPNALFGQDAYMGGIKFGSYDKYKITDSWFTCKCILIPKPENCTTSEACEKWLTDRYTELVHAIIKK